jgi:hypothetical protein
MRLQPLDAAYSGPKTAAKAVHVADDFSAYQKARPDTNRIEIDLSLWVCMLEFSYADFLRILWCLDAGCGRVLSGVRPAREGRELLRP